MTHEKFASMFWLILGIIILVSATIYGAWWHLGTSGICYIMYLANKSEDASNGEAE